MAGLGTGSRLPGRSGTRHSASTHRPRATRPPRARTSRRTGMTPHPTAPRRPSPRRANLCDIAGMPAPSQPARPAALWYDPATDSVGAIDQTLLPHETRVLALRTAEEVAHAIRTMQVRGAPLIGIAGAFGLALALREDPSPEAGARAAALLVGTRPTA